MMDFATARRTMIENQLRTYDVLDYNTLDAMNKVPRELFVPSVSVDMAYLDRAVSLGHDRELMTPMVFARLLQALDIKKTDRILDVAGGTGYSAAIFAQMADTVVYLEDNDELADKAQHNFTTLGIKSIKMEKGAVDKGSKKDAPYDIIFINGTVQVNPSHLLEQLADGGRLGCVFGSGRTGRAAVYNCHGDNYTFKRIFDAGAISLKSFAKPLVFSF